MAAKKPKKKATKKKAPAKKKCRKTTKEKRQKKKRVPGEGSTGPKGIDWDRARRLYVTSSRYITHEKLIDYLVDKEGKPVSCNVDVIHRRAAKEKWSDKRRDYVNGVTSEFINMLGEQYVLAKRDCINLLAILREKIQHALVGEKVPCERCAGAGNISIARGEGKDRVEVVQTCPDCKGEGSHIRMARIEAVSVMDLLAIMRQEMKFYEGGADLSLTVPGIATPGRGAQPDEGVEHVKKALLQALDSKQLTRQQLRKAVTK